MIIFKFMVIIFSFGNSNVLKCETNSLSFSFVSIYQPKILLPKAYDLWNLSIFSKFQCLLVNVLRLSR